MAAPNFESKKIRLLLVGIPIGLIVILFSSFMLKEYLFQTEVRQTREEKKKADLDYELKYREVMRRVYDNLKLKHYLAAYRNLEALEKPSERFKEFYTEYHEVLSRIARGMYENDFIDESEIIYDQLSRVKEHEDEARNSMSAIASKRRWNSARRLLEQGQELLRQKKFRDALSEFRKAKLEYDSVMLFKVHKVDDDLVTLSEGLRAASYEVLMETAEASLKESVKLLGLKDFEGVQAKMQHVAGNVGRAAYYGGVTERVREVRKTLFDLEAQLAYLVPNSRPLWNKFDSKMLDRYDTYFVLDDFHFQPAKDQMEINLNYQMQLGPMPYYVVRYKVHLKNGTWFFNGFFIEKKDQPERGQLHRLLIRQEFPKEFQGQPIRKIELSIFNDKNEIISRVSRALKT